MAKHVLALEPRVEHSMRTNEIRNLQVFEHAPASKRRIVPETIQYYDIVCIRILAQPAQQRGGKSITQERQLPAQISQPSRWPERYGLNRRGGNASRLRRIET
jgi:hypothetical protein